MKSKIAIVTLGCSKNTVDSEVMRGMLVESGYEYTEYYDEANIIIVNTCGFIGPAKEQSVEAILEAAQWKEQGVCESLVVSGCLAERYSEEVLQEIPEVDYVVGTGNIKDIVDIIDGKIKEKINVAKVDEEYVEGVRNFDDLDSKTAYVKIAEGCDNFCTYCIIPKLRGKYRSRKKENIIEEVNKLVENGVKEIILIAQDTTKYGIDIYGEYKLPELLDELNKIEEIKWIRILYMYPETFSDEIIQSIKRNEKVANYVDIPIQHINNEVLKRMNRTTSKEDIQNLIEKLRKEIPDITIRTTLIVGFPGETEEQFEELCEFVENIKFDRLGAFPYSQEEDTPAAKMDNQIEEEIKEERRNEVMEVQMGVAMSLGQSRVGKEYDVMIEEIVEEEGIYIGRTYMDSPEIDCVVYVDSKEPLLEGEVYKVKVIEALEYDLRGELVDEPSK